MSNNNNDKLIKWFILLCTPIGWLVLIGKFISIIFKRLLDLGTYTKKEKKKISKYERRIDELNNLIYLTKHPTPRMKEISTMTEEKKKDYINRLEKEIKLLQEKQNSKI